MRLDFHHHADQRVIDKLDMILATQEILMDSIDRLIEDIAAQKTAIEGMKTFIAGLKAQIADALSGTKLPPAVDAKLAAIFPDLEANTAAITAAVTTSPADPAPAPAAAPPADPAPAAAPSDPAQPAG